MNTLNDRDEPLPQVNVEEAGRDEQDITDPSNEGIDRVEAQPVSEETNQEEKEPRMDEAASEDANPTDEETSPSTQGDSWDDERHSFWDDSEEEDTGVSLAPPRPFPTRIVLKYIGILVVSILLLTGVIRMLSPSMGKVNRWIETKNYQKLDAFLESKAGWYNANGRKKDLFLYAIQKAVIHDAGRYGDLFIKLLVKTPDYGRAYLLQSVKNAAFSQKQIEELLVIVTSAAVRGPDNDQLAVLDGLLSKMPAAEADSLLHLALARQQGTSNDVKTLVGNSLPFFYFCKEAYPEFFDLYRMIASCGDIIKLSDKANTELAKSQPRIDEMEEDLAGALENNRGSFVLECWIVGQHDGGDYEIIVDPWGWDGGQRALLTTFSTEFTSRGNARIRVIKGFDSSVRVKEEFGGFKQSWPVYIEDTGYDERVAKVGRLRKEIKDLKDSIEIMQKSKNSSLETLDKSSALIFQIIDKYRHATSG